MVGGVELDDLADPAAARAAVDAADFVVSLEVRASAVTERADVVLPVAPIAERAGTFVNWEGRLRPFEQVLDSTALTDIRVLAGIADELGRPLGFRTVAEARGRDAASSGPGTATRAGVRAGERRRPPRLRRSGAMVPSSTWRMLIDDSRGNDGEPHLLATGRAPVAVLSRAPLDRLGARRRRAGHRVDRRRVRYAAGASGDIADDVVWLPANSDGSTCVATYGRTRPVVDVVADVEGGAG